MGRVVLGFCFNQKEQKKSSRLNRNAFVIQAPPRQSELLLESLKKLLFLLECRKPVV